MIMVNKAIPHISIIPEDDANRQIINGFCEDYRLHLRKIEIQSLAGGWKDAVTRFEDSEIAKMRLYPNRHLILVIDFDKKDNREKDVKEKIPDDLKDRVFVLGSLNKPESIKKLGTREEIGEGLAKDCYDNTNYFWGHEQLKRNKDELQRMRPIVNPIIF
jgi:hypothetical protein